MLDIKIQPKMNKNYWKSHGQIYDNDAEDPPTLRLTIPKNKYILGTDYFILCTLHPYNSNCDDTNITEKILPLSQHFIQDNDDICIHCNDKNIFKQMKWQRSSNNQHLFYTFELDNHRIVLVNWKNDEVCNRKSLDARKSQVVDMNLEMLDDVETSNLNCDEIKLCIGFTAFEKLPNSEHFTRISTTKYTNCIELKANLEIYHYTPLRGDVNGGRQIVLFLNSLKNYKEAEVRVYTDTEPSINFENIQILPRSNIRLQNIFLNEKTIIFNTPSLPLKLRNPKGNPPVRIQVHIPSTKETSNGVLFYYDTQQVTTEVNLKSFKKYTKQDIGGNSLEIFDPAQPEVKVNIRPISSKWILMHDSISDYFKEFLMEAFKDCVYVVQFPKCSTVLKVLVDNGYKLHMPLNVILLSETIESDFIAIKETLKEPLTTITVKNRNSIELYDPTQPAVKVHICPNSSKWIIMHDSISDYFKELFMDTFKDSVYIVKQFLKCSLSFKVQVANGYSMHIPLNVILLSEDIESDFMAIRGTLEQPLITLTARKRNPNSTSYLDPSTLEYAMDYFIAYKELMKNEENKKKLYPCPPRKVDFDRFILCSNDERPLIDVDCSIAKRDLKENTLLHKAIILNHSRTIDQFKEMFENYTEYSKGFQDDLKKLLKVHDKYGNTVMHAAYCKNMWDLVELMRIFCQRNDIELDEVDK